MAGEIKIVIFGLPNKWLASFPLKDIKTRISTVEIMKKRKYFVS
jgi:hypothetical protein